MYQDAATLLQCLCDERDYIWEILDDILIIGIIHMHIELLIVLPSLRLFVVEPQRGDYVRYACLFENSGPPQ